MWSWMNWLGRLDVILLALLLVHIVFVVGRVSHRCRSARKAIATDTDRQAFQRNRRMLVAELVLWVGSLRSIANIAPFLGLAGTCSGILSAFRGIGMEKHAAMAMMFSNIATALIPSAAGLLVAVPAVWAYNYLRTRIVLLESEIFTEREKIGAGPGSRSSRVARKFPLVRRFSHPPAFALIAAPCLAILAGMFTMFPSAHTLKGLEVGVLKPGGRMVRGDYFSTDAIVILVTRTGSIYVNSRKTQLDKLGNAIGSELRLRPQRVAYVGAEGDVPWAEVANVIDVAAGLETKVVLLTTVPQIR